MKNKLNLAIGKPDIGKPAIRNEAGDVVEKEIYANMATYTRFAIPFAFKLEATSKITPSHNLFYTLNDKTDLSFIKRRKYFTRETAETLYERGQWLSICNNWEETLWGKADVTVTLRNNDFKIGMLAPQIVLFEVPEIKLLQQCNILQTGFLYVDIYFPDNQDTPPQLDDLLVLNEYFRYFGIPYDNHAATFQKIFSKIPIHIDTVSLKESETIGSPKINPLECYFERWATMLEIPIKYDNQYFRLFPIDWGKSARSWMYNKKGSNQLEHWQIYADNRCYVWTVALLEKGGESLRLNFKPDNPALVAKDYGHWIKLLNVDNPPYEDNHYVTPEQTHLSTTEFEKSWTDERTYKRWEEGGTWYGFCYHSAAILSPHDPNNPNPKKRVHSFAFSPSVTYYFDTTILLFYIRMSLIRFGSELSKVTQIENSDEKRDQLRLLRDQFASFTVLYRFPMPSNQQQSIEMYEINRKYFDLDQFFTEIQQEIDNTHEFLETVKTNEQADAANKLASSANKLANLGIPLAAGGLLTALFSMNNFNLWECRFGITGCSINIDMLLQVALGVVLFVSFIIWKKNK